MKLEDRVNELEQARKYHDEIVEKHSHNLAVHSHNLAVFEHRLEALEEDKNDTIERLKEQIAEFSRELHSSNKEIVELKEENEKLSGRLSEAVEIVKEYVKISLTEPVTRSMIQEIELFKKAEKFLSEVEK